MQCCALRRRGGDCVYVKKWRMDEMRGMRMRSMDWMDGDGDTVTNMMMNELELSMKDM